MVKHNLKTNLLYVEPEESLIICNFITNDQPTSITSDIMYNYKYTEIFVDFANLGAFVNIFLYYFLLVTKRFKTVSLTL